MAGNIVLIHGWSADAHSLAAVAAFLEPHGYQVTQLWLSQYISLEDDVRIPDVAKRMDAVLRGAVTSGALAAPFDMIVHSTGGLVAREWLVSYGLNWVTGPPIERLLMLAPANFGSRLASAGKSMIGRLAKGWNNWLQTGEEMLNELELASAYQWDLARRDLVAEAPGQPSPYGPGNVLPFVICGSHGYASGLQQIANEHGSDGTVRPCAANLNVQGLTLDFAENETAPVVRPWAARDGAQMIAFAVLPDRSHASILDPADDVGSASGQTLGDFIIQALGCDGAGYAALCAAWDEQSAATAALDSPQAIQAAVWKDPPAPEDLHQYLQIVTRVVDDQGQPVDDYFLEFFSPQDAGEADSVDFHRCVLKDVHPNSEDASCRCLFIDRTALMTQFYVGDRTQVAMSLSAARIGPHVRYFDSTQDGAKGHVILHDKDDAARAALGGQRLWRNRTHLIEIRIPREPIDEVFKLRGDGT
jgi:hypothetical protein